MGRKKKKPPTQEEILPEHKLFDTGYLMRMLGLGADPIYKMCSNGVIEHFKINGLIYFHQTGIDDFLNRCRVKCRQPLVLLFFSSYTDFCNWVNCMV